MKKNSVNSESKSTTLLRLQKQKIDEESKNSKS